jgi:hypothetical protein
MVCTEEAAAQMNTIVNTLATDSEKIRANVLLAQNDRASTVTSHLLKEWTELSDHSAPEGFKLPIRVVPSNVTEKMKQLPRSAEAVSEAIGPLNTAIFLYGWAEGITTLSSNRVRAKQMDGIINQHGLKEGEVGPHVWLCGESRSLIAKHGRRK